MMITGKIIISVSWGKKSDVKLSSGSTGEKQNEIVQCHIPHIPRDK